MNFALKGLSACCLFVSITACSAGSDAALAKEPRVFRIGTTRVAPEPVYNRVVWAHLPDVVPSREINSAEAALITPVVHYEVRNLRLEDAAKTLAATANYSSYCTSTIARQKITLNRLGTIDELAEAISRQAGIKVVVDHEGRAVRFLPQGSGTPQFYGQSGN